jgi:hypothetical protein
MRRLYSAFGIAILVLYGLASWWGWGLAAGARGHVPLNVRQSPGGYRSYSYWRGGK